MTDGDRIRQKQQREVDSAPVSCRGILKRAYAGQSKATAIRAACLRCVGYLRAEVTTCSAYACPLWAVRPYQRGDEPDDPETDERANP